MSVILINRNKLTESISVRNKTAFHNVRNYTEFLPLRGYVKLMNYTS